MAREFVSSLQPGIYLLDDTNSDRYFDMATEQEA